jgi:hypothetical protein
VLCFEPGKGNLLPMRDDDHSYKVGRNRHQLCMITLEPKRRHDSRSKRFECVERVGHEKVLDGKDPEERIRKSRFSNGRIPMLVSYGRRVRVESLDGESSLLWG